MSRRYKNEGRDQFNFENVQGNVILEREQHKKRSHSESILLKDVADEVTSRLSQSLHNAVLINLDKQIQPQQVRNPLSAEIKIGTLPSQPLPPRIEISEVFERSDISGRLLILGDPGAGKTTTLLDLAKGLVERAIADSAAPIPVIFALSAWKDPKQEMKDWLIAELKSKYGVRIDIGKKWIEDKQLLPMLDGLDEVKPEHQESCVNAINQFLGSDDRPSDLVVCSRREEYETYQTQLHLNGAICLKDLTNEQIQEYLGEVNRPDLWQIMLQPDAELLELVKKPLFLSITVLSYRAIALEQWQRTTSTESRLGLLFDAYWEAMITRELIEPRLSEQGIQSKSYWKSKPPTARQTRRWLAYLAQQLQEESETEFLIEKMQFSWLTESQREEINESVDIITSALIAGGAILIASHLTLRPEFSGTLRIFYKPAIVLIAIVYGVCWWKSGLGGLFPLDKKISPLTKVEFYSKGTLRHSFSDLINGAAFGLFLGFASQFLAKALGIFAAFQIENLGGIVGALIMTSIAVYSLKEKRISSLIEIFLLIIVTLLFMGLGYVLGNWGQSYSGLFTGLVCGLFVGISSFIGRCITSFQLKSDLEVISKVDPNDGIWKSLVYGFGAAIIPTLFVTLSVALIRLPSFHSQSIYAIIAHFLSAFVIPVLGMGSTFGVIAFLRFGGYPCIQHLILRLVLFFNNSIPWNYARFLDYATERMFLQRIGGRYLFIHKLLQDHFAKM